MRGYVWFSAVAAVTLVGGLVLGQQRWTLPVGAPIRVKLVQANLPQDSKFTFEGLKRAFDDHWSLMQGARADLVALPESVFPVPLELVPPEALDALRNYMDERRSALIFGVFIEEPGQAFFNSAVGRAPDATQWQRYSKQQLVPFGEFIPWGFPLVRRPDADADRRPGARRVLTSCPWNSPASAFPSTSVTRICSDT